MEAQEGNQHSEGGRNENGRHTVMESMVLIQVADTEHSKCVGTFILGTSSEKATAANLQKYQGLKNYWGLLGEKSVGACFVSTA